MGLDKLWVEVAGRPLLFHGLRALAAADVVDTVVLVVARDRWEDARALAAEAGMPRVELAEGGLRRQDSVRAALPATEGCDIVAVHDGARVLCPPHLLVDVVAAADEHGAATTAVPMVDSVKRVAEGGGVIVETLDRSELVAVQTPQAFRRELLVEAHRLATVHGWLADDDSALVERTGATVVAIPGDPVNIKVTTPIDLDVVRTRLLASTPGSG
jgi:2-C-methyl-D-erythritol 4-phosphate cytidylyltransferase